MEPALQLLGNSVDTVKITVRWCPAGGIQVHPPPSLPGPEIRTEGANKRGALFKVKEQGLGFMALGRVAAGLQDAPPGNAAPMVAHDVPDLARATRTQELGNIPVRDCGPWRHQPDDGQDRFDVLIPH